MRQAPRDIAGEPPGDAGAARVGAPPPDPRGGPRRWRAAEGSPAAIVVIYALLGFLWIAFSDRALEAANVGVETMRQLQTLKGSLYVLVTAVLLFLLIRRSERGLRAVGTELRSTLESMADAVLMVDERGRIVELNRAALEMFGEHSKDALLVHMEEFGRKYALRYRDGTAVPLSRYASIRALRGEKVRSYDAIVRRTDGRDVHVNISAAPVSGGRTPLVVTVLRDVSPARRLEEARDEFLATAAHEFKTPLAVIKAYAQLMQKRDPEAQALAVIQRQVDRLNRLVQHLLDTSRLALEGAVRREPTDLSRLTGEVLERMRPSAPGHALTLVTPPRATVNADGERLERVITSLVDNAIRFSPAGGSVEVHLEARGDEVIFSVSDHGVGIPHERQARIFERYYRAHAGTPDDYGGLGLGLDVSREIVQRHGGRMWFESTPGQGSTFFFALPAAQEART